ncbi:MAG: AMIN domain-containing protein, partial [Candidatus Sulfotelmatobacter sp.]
MERSPRAAASLLACAAIFFLHVIFATIIMQAQDLPAVRRVQVLGSRSPVEIEIEASDRLVPSTQVLSGPDRLVVDFPNALPGAELRNQTLNRGDVKSVRVGLFTAKPPVTRVVIDLSGPQAYQVFPSGRTVIIRIGSAAPQPVGLNPSSPAGPRLVNSNYPVQAIQIAAPSPPPLVVSFKAGKLTINSNKASLSEVLFAVHQRTGADIGIPAGAEQEKVVAQIGPGSAPEVLSRLLTGTRFNFLILSTENDPGTLDRVILSARPDGPGPAQPLQQMAPVEDDSDANAPTQPPPQEASPNPSPNAGRQGSPANPQ